MGKKETANKANGQREQNSKRSRGSTLIPVILALAGIAVLLYPVVATQWNNARQLQIAYEYSKAEKNLDRQQLSESFKAAQAYNQHTPGAPILDPCLVIGVGVGHAGHVEQRRLDGGIAVAAHKAGSLNCETHGYSSLLCRLSRAPDLDLQAVARVPKYASLLFQVNLGHLENPF